MTRHASPGLPVTRNPTHETAVRRAVPCPVVYCRAAIDEGCWTKTGNPCKCHSPRYRAAYDAGLDLRTVGGRP